MTTNTAVMLRRLPRATCDPTHKARSGAPVQMLMAAPEREPLGREVEIDEFYLGGHEEGRKGGRAHGKKALVGAAIEVPFHHFPVGPSDPLDALAVAAGSVITAS